MMKRTLAIATIAAAMSLAQPAQATGIPTFDAATVLQLQQQYMQMAKDYELLKQQYAAVTGSYGRGGMGLVNAIQASSFVPGSWQEVVDRQNKGVYGSRQEFYESLLKTMAGELFTDLDSARARSYQLSTDSVRAALAGGDVLYAEIQTHLLNLSNKARAVDATANVKDAADLQNSIAAEAGMVQTAMAKLQVMNMNLQANLLNQQTQAQKNTLRYFGRGSAPTPPAP